MAAGGFCERHGPFDPPYTSCPYCAKEGDQRGTMGNAGFEPYDEDSPTNLPYREGASGFTNYNDEAPTSLGKGPNREGAHQAFFEEATQLPKRRTSTGSFEDHTVIDHEPKGPIGFLIIKEPSMRRGKVHQVLDDYVIGRQEAHVIIDDKKVSKQHGRIRVEENEDSRSLEFVLYDFGGPNGTYVNDKRIRGAVTLQENDIIRIGDTVMVFKVLE